MRKIGVTGGPGSGKTTFITALGELGVPYISADRVAYELTQTDSMVQKEISAAFPTVMETGEIDRQKLREIIFADPVSKKKLEDILHPPIIREIQRFFMEKEGAYTFVAVEVPLLFEANLEAMFDRIVFVKASEDAMKAHLMARDHISLALADAMLEAQWPLDQKKARSHVVIENNGDLTDLSRKAHDFYADEIEKTTKMPESS